MTGKRGPSPQPAAKPGRARPRRKAPADDSAAFERLAARWNGERYALRLYVIGMSPISRLAIRCLRAVCEDRLKGRYDLEVVDVHQQPELAHEAQLIATPTVVKSFPLPVRRLVGDMTNTLRVLAGLDLPLKATGS